MEIQMNYIESAEDIFIYIKSIRKIAALRYISDMTQGESAVLSYLLVEHNGATAGELTDAFGVGTSRTAALLNTLEKKGYAIRRPDPCDRRRVLVYITEEGRRVAEVKYREAIAGVAESLSRLGEEDATELTRIMRKVAVNSAQRRGAS